jgi:YHS domain-containing protein/thiol-disulfide isomerase/thioredoxin
MSDTHEDIEMRTPLFALSLSLFVAALCTAPAAAADLTPAAVWKTDFAAAEAEAKSLNCPLVVQFHATKWCAPCRQMEREVLDTASVLKALDAGFVAVKVDFDKNAKVNGRFKIEKVPTALIISPEGKVLYRNEGYVSSSKYMAKLSHIDGQYARGGKRVARADAPAADKSKTETPPEIANNVPPAKTIPAPEATKTVSASGNKLVPPPTEPKKVAVTSGSPAATQPAQVETKPEAPEFPVENARTPALLLAMDGYCPVTLRATRGWKPGSSEIAHVHEGQTFYFAAIEKREEFKANPGRYAPRLMGCDPVMLANNDLAIRGSVKFGAYYEGELFLFETAESRATFRKDPAKYARLQHVLKPEDVQKIARAVDE